MMAVPTHTEMGFQEGPMERLVKTNCKMAHYSSYINHYITMYFGAGDLGGIRLCDLASK